MEPVVRFNSSLQALKRLVEPAQSSNGSMLIPEAAEKLDQILSRAGKATGKLLGLLNQQEEILAHAERLILDLGEHLKHGTLNQDTLERELLECRVLNATIKKISGDMLYTQDIEDLCGFVIPKIKTLLSSVESDIRMLLSQVGIDVVDANACTQGELTDQWRIDQILEEFSR
jgi:chemotaxis regulatin CheY-phosphate phosphatase CheZ